MPTKERRAKERLKTGEKDGDYGPVDCGYVWGKPEFEAMRPLVQLAEILAWIACFKERDDVLKPAYLSKIRQRVGYKEAKRWQSLVEVLSKRGCWKVLPNGSLKVLKIKEKRPNFPWKGKGQKGQNEGTKTGNIEGITPSYSAGGNAPPPCKQISTEVEDQEQPIIRPTLSVAAGLKKILAAQKSAGAAK